MTTAAQQQESQKPNSDDKKPLEGSQEQKGAQGNDNQDISADDLWKKAGEQRAAGQTGEDVTHEENHDEDPFAGLPEPTRKLFEQIQAKTDEQDKALKEVNQKLATAHGTIGDLSKRLKDNLAELAKVKPAIDAVTAASKEEEAQRVAAKKVELEELNEQMGEFPIIKKFIDTKFADVKPAAVEKPKQVDEEQETPEQLAARLTAERELSDRHPKWIELVKTEEFQNWKKKQPEDVQALGKSEAIEDADKLLTKFKEDQKNTAEVARVAAERKERLERNQNIDGTGAASKHVDTTTDALWQKVKRDRERDKAQNSA